MNKYSEKAIEFIANIQKNVDLLKKDMDNVNWLLKPLKHLTFPSNMTLGAYCFGGGFGNNTELYFHNNDATTQYKSTDVYEPTMLIPTRPKDFGWTFIHGTEPLSILNYIHSRGNDEAIWEAHLLERVEPFLPLYDHAGYMRFHYIFSVSDLMRVHDFTEEQIELFEKEYNFDPVVEEKNIDSDDFHSNYWLITYYEWSAWGGLYKTMVKAQIRRGGNIVFSDVKHENIFKYDCGICY